MKSYKHLKGLILTILMNYVDDILEYKLLY